MGSIDNNVGRTNRLQPTPPTRGSGTSPIKPPSEPKVEARQDERSISARPQTDRERLDAALQAIQAANAGKPAAPAKEEPKDPTQVVADTINKADSVREGVRVSSSVDELRNLPVVGKVIQSEGRLATVLTALARSQVGRGAAHLFQNHRYVAPLMRGLGRIAPFAGVVLAGFDIWGAVKTVKDPKASLLEKGLSVTKGVLSGISGVAGVAAIALAPTGIGAAIAGGIALGAGLLATGADLWLGQVKKQREQAKPPAVAQKQ